MTSDAATQHAGAMRLLSSWSAPDAEQERLRQWFLDRLEAAPDALRRVSEPEHLTASAMVLSADARRACLVLHAKAGLWLQTGGHVEDGDADLASAALREAREESGLPDLEVDPVPLRLSRHRVPFCGGRPVHHLDVQFLVVAPDGAEPHVSEESDAVGWFDVTDPPEPTDDEVRSLLAAATRRRRGTPRP